MYDAQLEKEKQDAANKENGEETPGEQTKKTSEDGTISNEEDYQAEIDRTKKEVM
jgi:hypothetical protein